MQSLNYRIHEKDIIFSGLLRHDVRADFVWHGFRE